MTRAILPLGIMLAWSADGLSPDLAQRAKVMGIVLSLIGTLWWFSPLLVGGILVFGAVTHHETDSTNRWIAGWIGVVFLLVGIVFSEPNRRQWRLTRWRGGPQATDQNEAEQAASDWFDVGG